MEANTKSIDQDYKNALSSLRKINDELFYDELKETIYEQKEDIGNKYSQVIDTMSMMEKRVRRLPMELQEEVIEKVEELLEETKEEVQQSILRFNQNEEALNQAFEEKITIMQSKFETINDEQKNSIMFLVSSEIKKMKATLLEQIDQNKEHFSDQISNLTHMQVKQNKQLVENEEARQYKIVQILENHQKAQVEAIESLKTEQGQIDIVNQSRNKTLKKLLIVLGAGEVALGAVLFFI